MSKRLPAPPPPEHPGRPDSVSQDDDLDDGDDLDDLEGELEDNDDLDWLDDEHWPDDEPLEEELDQTDSGVSDPDDLGELDDADMHDAPEDDLLDLMEPPELEEDIAIEEEPLVLPWQTTAHLDGRELAVILDPTADRSVWLGGPGGTAQIQICGLLIEAELESWDAHTESLRLGRDVLRGRIVVSS